MANRPFFEPDQAVRIRDAWGNWHDATTVSTVEGTHVGGVKIHDFPVVLVLTSRGNTVPWPVEDIRHIDPACSCGCRGEPVQPPPLALAEEEAP